MISCYYLRCKGGTRIWKIRLTCFLFSRRVDSLPSATSFLVPDLVARARSCIGYQYKRLEQVSVGNLLGLLAPVLSPSRLLSECDWYFYA